MNRKLLTSAAERWLKEGRLKKMVPAVMKGTPVRKVPGVVREEKATRFVQASSIEDVSSFILGIAGHPFVQPAFVEIAIMRVEQAAGVESPLALVCGALGAKKPKPGKKPPRPLDPYVSDMPVVLKWEAIERDVVDASRAKAAVSHAIERAVQKPVQTSESNWDSVRGQLSNLKRAAHGGA